MKWSSQDALHFTIPIVNKQRPPIPFEQLLLLLHKDELWIALFFT